MSYTPVDPTTVHTAAYKTDTTNKCPRCLGDEGDPTLVGEIDPDFRVFGDEGDFFGWLSGLARVKEIKERMEEISGFLWDYVGFLPHEIKREDL